MAQLAAVVHSSVHLFSKILEATTLEEIEVLFKVAPNDFWNYHYNLKEQSAFKAKTVGTVMLHNIIVNTVCPMLFAYGDAVGNNDLKEKAVRWLEAIPAEKNTITKGFEALGLVNKSALDSQSFIEQKTRYCEERHCLKCSVGNYLLKKEK
ncbi:MAG: DUF2851 family protein, partial [Niabella sp.]|nr:DUF2851 family protein [Niabella sp.]